MTKVTESIKKIGFIHPDLGIGGAERLVVDAAASLQECGHDITIFTSHCDKSHSFEEVSSGQLKVEVYGDYLPTNICKRFRIFFAILRQLYLVLKLIFSGAISQFDYFVVDQLSFCIPFLIYFSRKDSKVMFYCHFPDLRLSKKGGWLKKLYRIPFNLLEEWTTGLSDKIVVNSNFTKSIFYETFTGLRDLSPSVIYPCVDIDAKDDSKEDKVADIEVEDFFKDNQFFLSINRFEKAKNISLAIHSFAKFKRLVPSKKKMILVVSGGYDYRIAENVEYLNELEMLCSSLKLTNFVIRGKLIVMPPSTDVLFLPSVSSSLKNSLIKKSTMLLYTPRFEHFGIVPLEGMLRRTPILGVNYGGPLETIVNFDGTNLDRATGFTDEPTSEKWAKKMVLFYELPYESKNRLGKNGHDRVVSTFSRKRMSQAFIENLCESDVSMSDKGILFKAISLWQAWFIILLAICIYIIY